MAEPLRHRQTKEAATDMFNLQPPRHIPTLPDAPFVEQTICELMEKDLDDDEWLQEAISQGRPYRIVPYQHTRIHLSPSESQLPDELQWALVGAKCGDIAPLRALFPPEVREYI